jgi:hypothetical protein
MKSIVLKQAPPRPFWRITATGHLGRAIFRLFPVSCYRPIDARCRYLAIAAGNSLRAMMMELAKGLRNLHVYPGSERDQLIIFMDLDFTQGGAPQDRWSRMVA